MSLKRFSIIRNNIYELIFNAKFTYLHPVDITPAIVKQTYDIRSSLIGIKSEQDKQEDYQKYLDYHKEKEVYISLVTSKSDNDIIGYISWRRLHLFNHKKWDKNIIMEGGYYFFRSIEKTDKNGKIKKYSNPFIAMYTTFYTFYKLTQNYPISQFDHYVMARMYPGGFLSVSSIFKGLVSLKDNNLNDFQKESLEQYYRFYKGADATPSHVMVMNTKPYESEVSKVPKSKYNRYLYDQYIKKNPNFAEGICLLCITKMSFSETVKSLLAKYFY